jgi:divalent anion:Na+ symporter, DASS family
MTESSQLRYLPLLICLLIGVVIWFYPAPEGVSGQGWHVLAIFIATVVGIVLKPLPMGGMAFLAMTLLLLTNTLEFPEVFSSLSSPVVWLVICAFFIAKAFLASGLATRIAYGLIALVGKRTLGLGYGLVACDLCLSPAIPSDTARSAGVIFPILRGLSTVFGSHPHDPSSRKMGAFLTLTAFHGAVVTSAMFMTAMATNPLIAELAGGFGVEITWGTWALAAVVPGMISLVVIPLLLYLVYPPSIRETPEAIAVAREKLREMGPISVKEWITLATLILMITLWIVGKQVGISPTTAAMTGICILLLTQVLHWKQLVREHEAWETLIWFSTLITMASFLAKLGVAGWFSGLVGAQFTGLTWQVAFPILSLIYFFAHYFFASNTSHVSALYVSFALLAINLGTPPMLASLLLAFFSSLFASLTHYGSAAAPLLFGGGYVDVRVWWRLGLLISVVNIVIWTIIGTSWWYFLGLVN